MRTKINPVDANDEKYFQTSRAFISFVAIPFILSDEGIYIPLAVLIVPVWSF